MLYGVDLHILFRRAFIFNGQKITGNVLNQLFKTWQWNRLG